MLKLLKLFTFISIFLISCSSNCKTLSGKTFVGGTYDNRYSYVTSYEFSGNNVTLLSMSKIGEGEYKKDNRQEGVYSIQGDLIVLNFGGTDVTLNINRESNGCIELLTNEFGSYKIK